MSEEIASPSTKDGRTRNWTFVLYPESAPADWREQLDTLHVPWVESPLHEYDVNPDGEVKKAHIHVVLQFRNKKSYEQVKAITESLNQPRPEAVADMRGMCRYLIHRDNPEKFQYEQKDILCHQGFDVAEYFGATKSEKYQAIAEMMEFIEEHNITEFTQFSSYCRKERFDDWFPLVCDSCAYVIDMQIRSMRHGAPHGGFGSDKTEEPAAGPRSPARATPADPRGETYE